MNIVKGPRVEREIELNLVGDWGWANIHRVCGWLGAGVMERAQPNSRYAIWSTPYVATETVRLIGSGKYDLAFSTSAHMVRNAVDGVGLYEGESYPKLMSIGTFPQTDSLVLAVDASLGIRTFDDIRKKKPALHISTQPNDGISYIGFAVDRLLAEAEVPREKILRMGWVVRGGGSARPMRASGSGRTCKLVILRGCNDAILAFPGARQAAQLHPV